MNNIEKNRAREIASLHGEIEGLLKLSLDKAIRIGELLTKQKASLKHGELLPWIKANLPFTERTAQNYMRLYVQREQLKSESVSHLTAAYALLTTSDQVIDENTHPRDEWHAFVRDTIHEVKERLENVYSIHRLEDRIAECKLLRDVLPSLTQSSAELLLYSESRIGELRQRAEAQDG